MGGGSYTPPKATPMPIEDSIGSRAERATMIAKMNGTASREANDLNQSTANQDPALTRASVAQSSTGTFDNFDRQPQPRGPRDRVSGPRGSMAAAVGRAGASGSIGQSAVMTG